MLKNQLTGEYRNKKIEFGELVANSVVDVAARNREFVSVQVSLTVTILDTLIRLN